jgi:hypothetical protein
VQGAAAPAAAAPAAAGVAAPSAAHQGAAGPDEHQRMDVPSAWLPLPLIRVSAAAPAALRWLHSLHRAQLAGLMGSLAWPRLACCGGQVRNQAAGLVPHGPPCRSFPGPCPLPRPRPR